MTVFFSEDSVFQINDGSSLRDISAFVTGIDGLPGTPELVEKTTLGDSGRTWFSGLENITFTVEFLWSNDAATGPHTVLTLVRALTAATAFDFGPEGKTATDVKYSGSCFLKNWATPVRVGDMVRGRAEFQVDGVVSIGAYT